MDMLCLAGKPLDDPIHPYVIAEAASSHCGSLALARQLVEAAATAGADAIKFQTYTPAELASTVPAPDGSGHSLRDLLQGGLPRAWHTELRDLAARLGLLFLSTPFSLDALRFLAETQHLTAIKIASGDCTYLPLLHAANATGLPVLLSTGTATLAEIQASVAMALLPTYQRHRLVLLHCVSAYPCPPEAANLLAIQTLQRHFPYAAIGWSDHTRSVDVIPALAVALGASVVEKHLCLRRNMGGMDAGHSLEPEEFAHMVRALHTVGASLGDGLKRPQPCEQGDRLWARRGRDGLRPADEARQLVSAAMDRSP